MDQPTKAVADYLNKKVRYLPEEAEKLFATKLEALKAFHEKNIQKHYGEKKQGWHFVVGHQTAEEEREYCLMTLLLLDSERYG